MEKIEQEKKEQKEREEFVSRIVDEVQRDFLQRQKERVEYERKWELNLNFLVGNQYVVISPKGEIVNEDKEYYWQKRESFNHIAPLIETRIAKLSQVTPEVSVRPLSQDDSDVSKAGVAEKLISGNFKLNDIHRVVQKVTNWSEACGSGFYKIVWNNSGGNKVGMLDGKDVFEGEVQIIPVSPFEIYPDSLYTEKVEDLNSIIHAKAVNVSVVKEKYGVDLVGKDVGVFSLTSSSPYKRLGSKDKVVKNAVIVIEKFERPSYLYPNGRLITVADDKLLYYGELPYRNGENGDRTFPFVKQDSISVSGMFFGMSVIERLIPVQRSYNAVKNRKHEFLNRLSMGMLTVEDGSLDLDDLEGEGLSPGKILVYRQGSKAPEMMSESVLPPDFDKEEDKLLQEFVCISGVSDVSTSQKNANLSSASALQILIEQDNERLTTTAEYIRRCYLQIASQVLKLYAQFISGVKMVKYKDSFNRTKVCYAKKDTALADDVYLESENELLFTPSKKKELVFKMYESGLLNDEEGGIRPLTKEKLLSLLGYKDLDYQKGISRLQEEKASEENKVIKDAEVQIEEIDDDAIHIDEHTRFVLSEYNDLNEAQRKNIFMHIEKHKERMNKNKNQTID